MAALTLGAVTVFSGASAGAQGYQVDNVVVNCTASVTIHTNGWAPGQPVSAEINPPLGTLVADAGGVVDGTLNLPAGISTGPHVLSLNGFDFDGVTPRTQTFDVTVGENCAGGLAFTGSNVGLILAIAAAVIIVGTAALLGARKRRLHPLSA